MHDNFIISNSDEQDNLMKEIKKMSYIKYTNLFISIIRFILMFYLIFYIAYFPASFKPTIYIIIIILEIILMLVIITIYFLIVILTGTINRDFWVRKKPLNFGFYTCFCCCCIMSKNVTFLKILSLFSTIIDSCWSLFLLRYLIIDFTTTNIVKNFPSSLNRTLIRVILNCIDSFLLLGQTYCFYYNEYFLKRVEKYLELYKRLIIKNKNKEASFVRNTLPAQIENYLSSDETELKNI